MSNNNDLEQCERCEQMKDDTNEIKIYAPDDFYRYVLCGNCQRGMWAYLDNTNKENE